MAIPTMIARCGSTPRSCIAVPQHGPNRWRDPVRPLSPGGRTLPAPLPGGASRRAGARGTFSTACQRLWRAPVRERRPGSLPDAEGPGRAPEAHRRCHRARSEITGCGCILVVVVLSLGGGTEARRLPHRGASHRAGSRWTERPAWESVLEEMRNPVARAVAGRFPHPVAARIAGAIRSALFRREGEPSPRPSPAAREGLSPQPAEGVRNPSGEGSRGSSARREAAGFVPDAEGDPANRRPRRGGPEARRPGGRPGRLRSPRHGRRAGAGPVPGSESRFRGGRAGSPPPGRRGATGRSVCRSVAAACRSLSFAIERGRSERRLAGAVSIRRSADRRTRSEESPCSTSTTSPSSSPA